MKLVTLISGGLDSILAARIMRDQGFDIVGLYFSSAFSKNYGKEENTTAARAATEIGIELRVIDLGQEYIDMIRNPKHGYGKHMNPCIDCKIFMLEKAKVIMQKIGAPCIVTGEVLGQRPMSQRRDTLNVIERDSGLRGMILRPLSAKLLSPTKAERDGFIDREKLSGISGRSRTAQYRLAEQFGITAFSAPAGGCLLTDKNFEHKLRDLFEYTKDVTPADIRLLTIGRHFRSTSHAKIILGRNNSENNILLSLAQPGWHVCVPHGFPGPIAIIQGELSIETRKTAGELILRYSKKISGQNRLIRIGELVFNPEELEGAARMTVTPVGTLE